jgi:hypothetical protein
MGSTFFFHSLLLITHFLDKDQELSDSKACQVRKSIYFILFFSLLSFISTRNFFQATLNEKIAELQFELSDMISSEQAMKQRLFEIQKANIDLERLYMLGKTFITRKSHLRSLFS